MGAAYTLPDITADQQKRAIRAHERRYGQSMLPYRFKRLANNCWRVTDDENGAFTAFGFRGDRLIVRYDGYENR